jgi:hypothetical protein
LIVIVSTLVKQAPEIQKTLKGKKEKMPILYLYVGF